MQVEVIPPVLWHDGVPPKKMQASDDLLSNSIQPLVLKRFSDLPRSVDVELAGDLPPQPPLSRRENRLVDYLPD